MNGYGTGVSMRGTVASKPTGSHMSCLIDGQVYRMETERGVLTATRDDRTFRLTPFSSAPTGDVAYYLAEEI